VTPKSSNTRKTGAYNESATGGPGWRDPAASSDGEFMLMLSPRATCEWCNCLLSLQDDLVMLNWEITHTFGMNERPDASTGPLAL
jgi:hypothetical protein